MLNQNRKSLDALRKEIKRMDWRTCFRLKDNTPSQIVLDRYFEVFAQPALETSPEGKKVMSEIKCIRCDEPQAGLFGAFTWGVAHGFGYCWNCCWPARAHHFIKDLDGKEVLIIHNFILQYHPMSVDEKERK